MEKNFALYKAFFENSMDMLCVASKDGYLLDLNSNWTTTLGYSLEVLKSKPLVEFVHPDDREKTAYEVEKLNNSGYKTISFTNRYLHKDGYYRWFLWSATPIGDVILGAAKDVTDIKERDELYSEMQQVANIGSWSLQIPTFKMNWSEQTYKICEIEPRTVNISENIFSLCTVTPKTRGLVENSIVNAIKYGKNFDIEFPIVTRSKNRKWVRVIGKPTYELDRVVNINGVLQDVTLKKASEQKIEEEKLKSFNASRLASLGEMAGSIAHEINNPLEIISLSANNIHMMTSGRTVNRDAIYKSCERISHTVHRIADIIRGLQNISRDVSNDQMEETTLGAIIDDVLAVCSQRFKTHGIELQFWDNGLKTKMLKCRQVELAQVLLNMLNNAFDATQMAGGKWTRIILNESEDGSTAKIFVEDSGSGVHESVVDRIMDPFFTTKPQGRGTGLGLSISKAIAQRHNGNLEFCGNTPFTRFLLSVPARPIVHKSATPPTEIREIEL